MTHFYDRHLRAIGQSLETRRINVFELKSSTGQYVVTGTPEKLTSFVAVIRSWNQKTSGNGRQTLTYGLPAIEQLERLGRSKRQKSERLPDFYNVSSLLRTVGAYLEVKQARLLQMQKRPLNITVLYQTEDGHPHVEDRTIASFYDFFMDQYGKRSRSN